MIPDPADKPVMSVEEAGRELGLSRSSAYAAVARGDIPSLCLGRRRLIPTAAFRRLLALDLDEAPEETSASVTSITGRQGGRDTG